MNQQTFFILGIGCLFALCSGTGCKKDSVTPSIPSKLEEKTFHSPALADNLFGDPADREVLVYTPPGYDPNGSTTYPVVYLLHGMPFGDSSFVDPKLWAIMYEKPDFPKQGFRLWMDSLIEAKVIQPMLIAMPDAKTAYGFCFYTNSILQGNYEDFIAEDLVNFMDSHYKTIANRNGRVVIGHSQGGYGAIRMGLMRSETFSVVAAHVGFLWFEGTLAGNPYLIAENPGGFNGPAPEKFLTTVTYGAAAAWSPNLNNPPWFVDLPVEYPSGATIPEVFARWLQHDPYTLLETHADHLRSLKGIYVDAGLQDAWGDLAVTFHNGLTQHNVPHHFETFNGGHFSKMFQQLEASLAYCSDALKN